jgi:hypothetical protein
MQFTARIKNSNKEASKKDKRNTEKKIETYFHASDSENSNELSSENETEDFLDKIISSKKSAENFSNT